MSTAGEHADLSFEAWMAELATNGDLTPKGREVLALLRTRPQLSAFASSRKFADAVGVNVGTIVRTAQGLGFEGWTDLQQELRARYLAGLTAVELSEEHEQQGASAAGSLERDRDALDFLVRSGSVEQIRAVARTIAEAGSVIVLAQGSFAAPGLALVHNARLAGYPLRHVGDASSLVNAVSRLAEGDVLIVINCWHIWGSSITALEAATEAGVETVVVTDTNSALLGKQSTHQLVVPSESAGFFPSLVGALAVCQAVVVELAALDPARTRRAVADSEREWERFGLLHRGGRRTRPGRDTS